jgi:hypothetical protein
MSIEYSVKERERERERDYWLFYFKHYDHPGNSCFYSLGIFRGKNELASLLCIWFVFERSPRPFKSQNIAPFLQKLLHVQYKYVYQNCIIRIVFTIKEVNRLNVFENRIFRRIAGPKKKEVTRGWKKKLHEEKFHNLLFTECYKGDKIKTGEMDGEYSTYETDWPF